MTATSTKPDLHLWAVGMEVAVFNSARSYATVEPNLYGFEFFGHVTRLTPTQVIVGGVERFRRADGRRVGGNKRTFIRPATREDHLCAGLLLARKHPVKATMELALIGAGAETLEELLAGTDHPRRVTFENEE